jgi:hypothetical protein
LAQYPVVKWHGGQVQFIQNFLIHLMRAQVYEIDGKRFFTMGGAYSHDISDGIWEPNAPDFLKQYIVNFLKLLHDDIQYSSIDTPFVKKTFRRRMNDQGRNWRKWGRLGKRRLLEPREPLHFLGGIDAADIGDKLPRNTAGNR